MFKKHTGGKSGKKEKEKPSVNIPEEKKEEVIIEKVVEPIQVICKAAGCSQYAVKEGFCQHCYNNLHSVGYK